MRFCVAALCTILGAIRPAEACRPPNNLTDQDIAAAESVFIGRIVDLKAPEKAGRGRVERASVVTFEVYRTVRGSEVVGRIEVYGAGGAYISFPASIHEFERSYGSLVEVGIISPATLTSHTQCGSKSVHNGLGEVRVLSGCENSLPIMFNYFSSDAVAYDRPWIVGTTCTIPYIIPADSDRRKEMESSGWWYFPNR